MLRNIYLFMIYAESGKKIRDVVNRLFPGLIREPQRVRVPVRNPAPEAYRNRRF